MLSSYFSDYSNVLSNFKFIWFNFTVNIILINLSNIKVGKFLDKTYMAMVTNLNCTFCVIL